MNQILCTLLVALCCASVLRAQECDTVRVRAVTGVDAFTLEDGTTIGLLGITAPKSRAVTTRDCSEHLRSMIEGSIVCLARDTTVADLEGTTPQRLVYLSGELINQKMVEDGYAVPSRTQHRLASEFTDAHATAKSLQRGAHAYVPEPEEEVRSSSATTSVQCSGRTKKGSRCKRMTTDASGRCYQH